MDIPLKCKCGSLQGVLVDIENARSKRAICMCRDCRAFPQYLGCADEILDKNGGSEILPTYPSNIKLTDGTEHLKAIRTADDGMIRWYAGCCNTPVANTMPIAKLPFASLHPLFIDCEAVGKTRDEALGPVYARINAKYGYGEIPSDAYQNGSNAHLLHVLKFFVIGWVKGKHQPSPFFTTEGETTVTPVILSHTEAEYEKLLSDLSAAN